MLEHIDDVNQQNKGTAYPQTTYICLTFWINVRYKKSDTKFSSTSYGKTKRGRLAGQSIESTVANESNDSHPCWCHARCTTAVWRCDYVAVVCHFWNDLFNNEEVCIDRRNNHTELVHVILSSCVTIKFDTPICCVE